MEFCVPGIRGARSPPPRGGGVPGAASGTLVAGPCIVTRGMVGRPSMLRCLPCVCDDGRDGGACLEFSGTQ
eukprot:5199456-Prymnesium_polylepis.1